MLSDHETKTLREWDIKYGQTSVCRMMKECEVTVNAVCKWRGVESVCKDHEEMHSHSLCLRVDTDLNAERIKTLPDYHIRLFSFKQLDTFSRSTE